VELVGFLFFTLTLSRLCSNLFIVFFEGSKVLSGLAEFTLFHPLTNIPVDKCPLGIHEVKFVVQA
jgi:hypothetical protein